MASAPWANASVTLLFTYYSSTKIRYSTPMTKPLFQRLLIIASVLLLLQGGAFFFLQRAKSSEVRPLNSELSEIPYDFGTPSDIGLWHGEDQDLDENIERTVGARHAISRSYTDGKTDRVITVHIADWDSLKTPTLPHPPVICYAASGAQIILREPITVNGVDEVDPMVAELMIVENRGVRTLVLYWYAWDEVVCTTRGQACLARLGMIGSREWPPVIKVMLSTRAIPNESDAKEALLDFASQIRQLTKEL